MALAYHNLIFHLKLRQLFHWLI